MQMAIEYEANRQVELLDEGKKLSRKQDFLIQKKMRQDQ